jgi:hypothetical protein
MICGAEHGKSSKMRTGISSFAAVLLLSSSVHQQSSRAPARNFPEEIVRVLRNGDQEAIARVAEANELVIPKEESNGAKANVPCQSFQSVRLRTVVLNEPGPQQVIEARSESCEYFYIVVFEPSDKAAWKRTVTLPVRFHARGIRIAYEALLGTPEHQILIHGYTAGWGTGIWEYDFLVVRYVKGRFQVVLDVPEEVNLFEPDAKEPNGNAEEGQQSEFMFEDSKTGPDGSRGTATSKLIVEKQIITKHDLKIVRWRAYFWDEGLGCFSGMPW